VNPNYINAWLSRAKLFEKDFNHSEALKCYDEIIKIKPDYPYSWIFKSELCKGLKRYDESLHCISKAKTLLETAA